MSSESIVGLYERHARQFDADRSRDLFEKGPLRGGWHRFLAIDDRDEPRAVSRQEWIVGDMRCFFTSGNSDGEAIGG